MVMIMINNFFDLILNFFYVRNEIVPQEQIEVMTCIGSIPIGSNIDSEVDFVTYIDIDSQFDYFNDDFFLYISILEICLGLGILLIACIMTISEDSVYTILYLLFIFLFYAQFCVLLDYTFLGIVLVLVYIGAVCVLMLFHVKLMQTFLSRIKEDIRDKYVYIPFLCAIFIIPVIVMFDILSNNNDYSGYSQLEIEGPPVYIDWLEIFRESEANSNVKFLGCIIYDLEYLNLLLGSLILFVAMLGSIFMTVLKKDHKKFQDISKQVFVSLSKFESIFKRKK